MGKKFSVHLRKEEAEFLYSIARHRTMEPRALAQDLVTLGIAGEVEKFRKAYGSNWKKKIAEKSKGTKYE